jgi:hypothetical protein
MKGATESVIKKMLKAHHPKARSIQPVDILQFAIQRMRSLCPQQSANDLLPVCALR